MTSSILWPRRDLALCSPSAHLMLSPTFVFPQPFGPTTHVTPGKTLISVRSANDLKPCRTMDSRRIATSSTDPRARPSSKAPAMGEDGTATPRYGAYQDPFR